LRGTRSCTNTRKRTISDIEKEAVDLSIDCLLENSPPHRTDPVEFLRAQYDAGLAYVWFPEGYGGLGLPLGLQGHVDDRLAASGAPETGRVTNAIAAGQGAATILAFGTEEQKRKYLRPLFTAELMGCQLYSEPGSGSDLASLGTRAERDGDEWVVNGQKVWTSGAHRADMAILLARTDPDAPKHAGLTQFVVDMHQPGVVVRPLRQMNGGTEFNEVFLTDVRIPDAERLGQVNDGWAVSRHTLAAERYNLPRIGGRGEGTIGLAVAAWKARTDRTSPWAQALRSELMQHWVDMEVVRLLQLRAFVLRASGNSGPEGSLGKLAESVFRRRLGEWMPALDGPAASVLEGGYDSIPDEPGAMRRAPSSSAAACVGSPATAIAGGTDQIQRNIIGDRLLGLPREPAVDHGVPWSQTLRN
jgi:alkylation response protein AidB-like acyl-CoA dehydrogenase